MTTPEGATPFKKKDLNPTYAPDAVTRTTGLKSLDPPTDAEREEMRNGTNGHDSEDHDSDDHDSNDQGGEGSDSTTKPVIRVTCAELDVMERQSRSAVEKYQPSRPDHERLYTQDGRLVWVREVKERDGVHSRIQSVRPASLGLELSQAATLRNAKSVALPPHDLVAALAEGRKWALPGLRTLTGVPILHADGSLCERAGYDAPTQTLYTPRTGLTLPPIPREPTEAQAQAALALVCEPFRQFPCDRKEEGESRTHMLALLLTLALRHTLTGLVPMAAVTAPEMSYGKTLVAEVAYMATTGEHLTRSSVPSDESEWGKQILAWLREGRDAILLDNADAELHSNALEQVLTAEWFSRRLLGTQDDARVANDATWIITGNNLVLRGALPRRVYRITLGGLDKPAYQRKSAEFTHPNLLAWVRDERANLLAACFTLYRFWLATGARAPGHGRELTSYEGWSHTIGGVLASVGVEDFLLSAHEKMATTDPSRAEWEAFMAALRGMYGLRPFRVKQVFADHIKDNLMNDELRATLPERLEGYLGRAAPLTGEYSESGRFNQQLGHELAARCGRVFGGFRLVLASESVGHGNQFAFEPVVLEKGAASGE